VAVQTLDEAATWVDRVGLAFVFPKDDLVLPSLWEAAGGGDRFSERDASGEFVRWVPPMDFVWSTKSDLPTRGLACGGNHLRGRATLISLSLLPALVATAEGRDELEGIDREVAGVVSDTGPVSTRELPELLPHHGRKPVRAALDRLQRRLVLTNVGLEDTARWPAAIVDLVDSRYADRLTALPTPEDARRTVARTILESAGDLSAADLAAVLSWRRKLAAQVLDELGVPTDEEHGIRIWKQPATKN
jgi:hypothetical protein